MSHVRFTSRSLACPARSLTFHCRITGDPDLMPVLFVHGSFATGRWWEPLMRLLSGGFYLVAPDLRGAGRTWANFVEATRAPDPTHGAEAYQVESLAADLAALVDALGWDEFELVAHSSGGAAAMEYALTHGERVRTLTLIDPAPAEGIHTPVEMLMLLEQMRTDVELRGQALAALMPSLTHPGADAPDEDVHSSSSRFFDGLVEDAGAMDPAAYAGIAQGLERWNRFREVGQLTMPTLLIWGELDTVVDRDTITRTLIAIPGAHNLEVIRNVGHSPMIEAPVAVAERFLEFVTDDLEEFEEVRRDGLEG